MYQQITEFSDAVGGLGHLLMMGQAGHMSHEDTVENLTLFAKEVMPRLRSTSPRNAPRRPDRNFTANDAGAICSICHRKTHLVQVASNGATGKCLSGRMRRI